MCYSAHVFPNSICRNRITLEHAYIHSLVPSAAPIHNVTRGRAAQPRRWTNFGNGFHFAGHNMMTLPTPNSCFVRSAATAQERSIMAALGPVFGFLFSPFKTVTPVYNIVSPPCLPSRLSERDSMICGCGQRWISEAHNTSLPLTWAGQISPKTSVQGLGWELC